MRFNEYLTTDEYINNFINIYCLSNNELNEMSTETFNVIKKVGDKLGVRVKKSESIFTYLKRAGKNLNDLFRLSCLYLLTDITDNKSRDLIVKDAKEIINKIDRKELVAFLLQIDKASFGLTAHIRHIFQSVFGLEIATYNKWLEDREYIEKELRHIKSIMKKMGLDNTKEMDLLLKFQNGIEDLIK